MTLMVAVSDRIGRPGLAARVIGGFVLVCAEKSLLGLFVDVERQQVASGIGALLRATQHFGLRMLVTLVFALAVLAPLRARPALLESDQELRDAPLSASWFLLHALLLVAVTTLSTALLGAMSESVRAWLYLAWTICSLLSLLALLRGLAPLALWWRAARRLGSTWLYAASIAVAAVLLIEWCQTFWPRFAVVSFALVRAILALLIPGMRSDPETLVLDTGRFAVQIFDQCSGVEGIGLMLAFCTGWIVSLRQNYRFPHALVLLPLGAALVFLLNILRIVLLIGIGHEGYAQVAAYGFHSQSGWIAFNIAAGLTAWGSLKVGWLQATPAASRPDATGGEARSSGDSRWSSTFGPDLTTAYLAPFVAVLAAALVSRSLSTPGFEPLYGLRLLAGAVVLLLLRRSLMRLDWRFSWRGVASGAAVFLVWVAAASLLKPGPQDSPASLQALPPELQSVWILIRAFTGVLIVPLVEELAYRGYLLRRLVSAEFDAVPYSRVGFIPLAVSSLAFGLVHGPLWAIAIVTGMAFGWLVIRSNRLGEAIAAHVTCNALIAIDVLAYHHWELW